ncbi:MAG: hypothetical protein MR598_04695 [Erysipelotrichaceae bacterium]|nr:hypothetical protein [Erysipelotrichaceae bacterium]
MWILVVVTMIILTVGLIYVLKLNKKNTNNEEKEIGMFVSENKSYFPTIQIIENNTLIPDKKNKINDLEIKKNISIIDNTVVNSSMVGRNLKNSTELLNNNRTFFSASKKGTENMMKVKGTNEVYGTQVIGNKFNKQTKFTNENQMIQKAGKDALINAGFNTASMIVGQYYMNEINNKLDNLKEEINVISDYLDSEYKSRLSYIVSKIKEITENKLEILCNDFSKDKRYDEILELESDCAELLGQANEMIKNNISKKDIDYSKYEKKLKEIYKWFSRQQILQVLLLEIGNLRYVLAKGNETSKLSHTQYNNYLLQSNNINEALKQWHDVISKKLGIDISQSRRNGKFFKARKYTIGKINEDWAYNKLDEEVVKLIENQTNAKKLEPYINNKQDEIIKIQKYNGEYYNLLGDGNNN